MDRQDIHQEALSPSEWRVFALVSRRQPLTVAEIANELARQDPELARTYSTVKTFAERLCRKGYLRRDPQPMPSSAGRDPFAYRLAVPYEAALRLQVHRFLDQFALLGDPDLDVIRTVLEERQS